MWKPGMSTGKTSFFCSAFSFEQKENILKIDLKMHENLCRKSDWSKFLISISPSFAFRFGALAELNDEIQMRVRKYKGSFYLITTKWSFHSAPLLRFLSLNAHSWGKTRKN